jgi:signal transduction histidine kinase
MAALPQHPGAGARVVGREDAARDELLASLSRELRFSLDRGGCLTLVDGAWRAVVGAEPRALLGAHWTTIVAPVDHGAVRVAIERARSHGVPQGELELHMESVTGPPALVHWTLAPGPGSHAIVAVGHERTSQHRAAAEARGEAAKLQTRVDELEEHSRAMEAFAAIAAHQLAEPLIVAESGAIMIAEELDGVLDPDLRARLDGIGRRAAGARQVVDALLLDARSRTGVSLAPVEAEGVVLHVLEDLRPRLDERSMHVELSALPTVRAERRLLAIVYENLLSNAIKYGPRDGGCIQLAAEPDDRGWRLTVTSEGAPLTGHDRTGIFEPFRRMPGERRAPGSGLGLAICARLIDRLGGTIGVDPGAEGNTFWFVLPRA